MTESLAERHGGGRFATLIDQDGNPPCDPPDDCDVCRLFTVQRPGESRAEWLTRITRLNPHIGYREAS